MPGGKSCDEETPLPCDALEPLGLRDSKGRMVEMDEVEEEEEESEGKGREEEEEEEEDDDEEGEGGAEDDPEASSVKKGLKSAFAIAGIDGSILTASAH